MVVLKLTGAVTAVSVCPFLIVHQTPKTKATQLNSLSQLRLKTKAMFLFFLPQSTAAAAVFASSQGPAGVYERVHFYVGLAPFSRRTFCPQLLVPLDVVVVVIVVVIVCFPWCGN